MVFRLPTSPILPFLFVIFFILALTIFLSSFEFLFYLFIPFIFQNFRFLDVRLPFCFFLYLSSFHFSMYELISIAIEQAETGAILFGASAGSLTAWSLFIKGAFQEPTEKTGTYSEFSLNVSFQAFLSLLDVYL